MECKDLFALFARDLTRRGDATFFGKRTAIRFLRVCGDNGYYVVALEGFRLSKDAASPDPNWVADYSSWARGAPRETIARAQRLIEHAPDEMSFSLVVKRT